jgi:hypothetical protein
VRRQPTVAEAVVLAAGLLVVVASFLPFTELGGRSFSAWAAEPFLFPLSTLPALLALAGVVLAGAPLVWSGAPERPGGVDPRVVVAAAGTAATLVMLAWLAVDKGGEGLAAGGVLMLVGSAVMAAAAVASTLGRWSRPLLGGDAARPRLRVIHGDEDRPDDSTG